MVQNKKQRDEVYSLLAKVKSVTCNYYIETRTDQGVNDAAAVDLLTDIIATAPKMPEHIGKEIAFSLMCARSYPAPAVNPKNRC